MGTPVRRSRRLEGLNPEPPESPTSVLRARRALVEFKSNPEVTKEPGSPPSPPRQLGLESPGRQAEASPGSPGLRQDVVLGSPRKQSESDPGSSQHQQNPSLESPRSQPESIPDSSLCQPKPSEEPPKFSQDPGTKAPKTFPSQAGAGSEWTQNKEEVAPGSPQHHLQPGPGSPEPSHGQQATGPEPSQPLQELKLQSPSSPRSHLEPGKPTPAEETVVPGVVRAKKRKGSSSQTPASKALKKEAEEVLMIPKGKPKSGRVWKDRSKKRFSQMVQDKPLRTSWQRKMKERQERKLTKDFAQHLKEEKERRRQEKQQRRAENLKRRLENERKAEVVQVIRNPTKLKRAKKKQLRAIEKRDTLALLQKQPPQRPAVKI
ncbi:PREDICTED: coiled-coil domain-containing protein 86 [Chrysochloris asiatica]|uniref:Coiled-coil domain-containing protein 86 n=1 Tax=Chrysochloris asiatica TaxID=185453 RepID=A0A9B0U7N9_CHRAS|nr:PREDICTED: coiled-coil domain-containing protein 86 [Chrysochloris asiatica]